MTLHPQAATVLAQMPAVWRDLEAIESMTAEKARSLPGANLELGEGAQLETPAVPAEVAVEEIEVTGVGRPLRGLVYRPGAETPVGTVLWMLGGGFVFPPLGSPRLAGFLARSSGCAVVAVDYRLAPEHPYPAALQDADAALGWVVEHAADLGGEAGRIGIGGDSAGGNLAAALTLLARSRGGPELAFQVLIGPMLARAFDAPSRRDPAIGVAGRPEAIEWGWRQYLGDRDGSDPLACPLCAETLRGLPPALVVTAEYDALRDEGEAYAARLAADGVAVETIRYEGMFHGFEFWPGLIDAADECIARVGAAFRRALRPADGGGTSVDADETPERMA